MMEIKAITEEIYKLTFGHIDNEAGRQQAKQDIETWLSTQDISTAVDVLAKQYQDHALPWGTTKYSKRSN